MCEMTYEGTSHTKCGHFVQKKLIARVDCNSTKCANSVAHPTKCPACQTCEQSPIEHEKITAYSDTWCHLCEEWYGESARRRR